MATAPAPSSSNPSLLSILEQAGFKGQGLKTAYAIALAESGGRASAYNGNASTGDNSYGLFQINMLGQMGADRLQRYGLSANTDLFNPLTNAKVAYALSKGGTDFSPWSTYTSGAYKNHLPATGMPALVTEPWNGQPVSPNDVGGTFNPSAVNTPGANPFGPTDTLDPNSLKAYYGWTQAFLQQNPELQSLFNQALGQKGPLNPDGTIWTPAKFEAELQASNWYQTHSDTARQYLTMKSTDPAKYAQTVQQQFQKIHDLSIKMGALTPYAVGMKMAEQSLMAGWGDSQITAALQSYVKQNAQGSYQGDAATAAQTLKKFAYDNGVNVSDSWLQGAVSSIEGGNMSLQQAQQTLQGYASSAFPGYKEQLQTGMTMSQIADPFIQSYSKIMGVDPATINMFTPQIRKAMAGTIDPKTGQAQPQSIWQFEQSVRQDPAWMTTKDANDTLSTLGHKVLQDMGVTW